MSIQKSTSEMIGNDYRLEDTVLMSNCQVGLCAQGYMARSGGNIRRLMQAGVFMLCASATFLSSADELVKIDVPNLDSPITTVDQLVDDINKYEKIVDDKLEKKRIEEDNHRVAIDLFNQGYAAFEEKRYEDAKDALLRSIGYDANEAEAHNVLGVVYNVQGDVDNALQEFSLAVSLVPDNTIFHYNVGMAYLAKGRKDEAKKEFETAINSPEHSVLPHARLADMFRSENDISKEKYHLEVIAKNKPDDEEYKGYRLRLEEIVSQEKKFEQAKESYSLGESLFGQKKYDEAAVNLKKGLEINPDNYHAHNMMGIIYSAKGEHVMSEQEYAAAVRLLPNNPVLHHNLGCAYASQKKYDSAIREFEKSIELNGNDISPLWRLSDVYRNKGDIENALKYAVQAMGIKRTDPNVERTLNTLIASGKVIPIGLKTAYFSYDSSYFSLDTKQLLDSHISWMKRNNGAVLMIEGHTDTKGDELYNQSLGINRANSVRNYMVNNGAPNDRVFVTSFGEEKPLVGISGEDPKNRRTEFSGFMIKTETSSSTTKQTPKKKKGFLKRLFGG